MKQNENIFNDILERVRKANGGENVFLKKAKDFSVDSSSQIPQSETWEDKWPRRLLEVKNDEREIIVAQPETTQAVAAIIESIKFHPVTILARGGGSGVCGAIDFRENLINVVLDMTKMNKVVRIDEENCLAETEAGILGEELEKILNERGFTLGHYPASLRISSVGGWLATRSAGQASGRYGRIEQMVKGVEIVLGSGEILEIDNGISTIGPDFLPVFLGSEGTLGIVTKAKLTIKPLPAFRIYQCFQFANIGAALRATQKIIKNGGEPAVIRIYDGIDAKKTLAVKNQPKELNWLSKKILERDNILAKTIDWVSDFLKPKVIIVSEGRWLETVKTEGKTMMEILKIGGGAADDPQIAEDWFAHRYDLSFEHIENLVKEGCFVDTMDITAPWDKMEQAYTDIKKLTESTALIFAHFSHFTWQGGCIYFTFAGKKENRLAVYDTIWEKVLAYGVKNNLGIADHHGIGKLKQKYFWETKGGIWQEIYRQFKKTCDPWKVLNVGRIIDEKN